MASPTSQTAASRSFSGVSGENCNHRADSMVTSGIGTIVRVSTSQSITGLDDGHEWKV